MFKIISTIFKKGKRNLHAAVVFGSFCLKIIIEIWGVRGNGKVFFLLLLVLVISLECDQACHKGQLLIGRTVT